MMNIRFLSVLLSSIILSACSDETVKTIGDIEFQDEYIQNCVLKNREQVNPDTGNIVLKHQHVDVNGLIYEDPTTIPVTSITEVGSCEFFNNFAEYNTPDLATSLKDLQHFPNLKKLYLDFPVSDWSDLSRLTSVEQVTVDNNSNLTEFDLLSTLPNLTSLYFNYPNIDDWQFLSKAEKLNRFGGYFRENQPFTGLSFLPKDLQELWLSDAYIVNEQALSRFSKLTSLTLFFYDEPYQSADDWHVLSTLEELKSIYFRGARINDLTALKQDKLSHLSFDIYDTNFDFNQLGSLEKLVELQMRFKVKPNAEFRIDYNASGEVDFDTELIDTSYAYVNLYGVNPGLIDERMSLEWDEYRGLYLIKDIPSTEILTLVQLWQKGHLVFD